MVQRRRCIRWCGEKQEAINAYDEAIKLKPDYAVAYLGKGVALQDQGKLGEAIEAFDKAISINPTANAYQNKALTLDALGKYEEAISSYTKAITLNSNEVKFYHGKVNALYKLGKIKGSI